MSEPIASLPPFAALVLAGGQSSRMGEDKALILWEGKSFLQRVCEVASHCTPRVYLMASGSDRYGLMLTPEVLSSITVQTLPETNHGWGPLGALWEGLRQIEAEWVLLLACDLPLLDPAIIHTWATQLGTVPPESLALVPYQGRLWHPMCGFYRRQALEPLGEFLNQGGRSFQRWLPLIASTPLAVGKRELEMLRNFNTPTDLQALNEAARRESAP
jgi:molybdenum cofactor guanylyltransferase